MIVDVSELYGFANAKNRLHVPHAILALLRDRQGLLRDRQGINRDFGVSSIFFTIFRIF